ncbi:MAG: MaoC family dehydratase N-terminal domain-containing protein [Microthrixaceae bacterium]|nr:MaoC family dehydratase N-terminal domain-containing protein [Microthrixaceae bacterium]MCO5313268.1 MaoC family dehydratase N-terminal domain-containing protein [Microthrixaceae bacterium]
MALNLESIGSVGRPVEVRWSADDTMLYALAVGAGYPDPLQELAFTTENTTGVEPQALPTFAVVHSISGMDVLGNIGAFNPAMLVHAEQSIELHRPLSPSGAVSVVGRLADIVDKRSGALVRIEAVATDIESEEPAFTALTGAFIRGEGGFAEEAGAGTAGASAGSSGSGAESTSEVTIPERDPDVSVEYETLANQALLYRLCGDRNPLHSDPTFAAFGGFDRPILHGLCTYGFAGRALLQSLCEGDSSRFVSMNGRFSKPVLPGQTLSVDIWRVGDGAAAFRTRVGETTVIDRGSCRYRP